jgi:hypothetical protein
MGPLNLAMCAYGGGTLGRNPFDLMHFLERLPQGSINTFWSSMRGLISYSAMATYHGLANAVGFAGCALLAYALAPPARPTTSDTTGAPE